VKEWQAVHYHDDVVNDQMLHDIKLLTKIQQKSSLQSKAIVVEISNCKVVGEKKILS